MHLVNLIGAKVQPTANGLLPVLVAPMRSHDTFCGVAVGPQQEMSDLVSDNMAKGWTEGSNNFFNAILQAIEIDICLGLQR